MSAKRIWLLLLAVLALCGSPSAGAAEAVNGGAFEVVETTIGDIHAAMKSGRLTARQLVQAYLDRIDAYDKHGPMINCVISVNPKALEQADQLDADFKKTGFVGPLHGIPILVKDQVDTAGMPTTLGSVVFKDYNPPLDAYAIAKLRKAGAIILGKTTLGEFGAGDAYGSLFGVTRNPYDTKRTVGGSSGGSGACTNANFSTVAVGEEGFASIRRPSTWNSVVGMRPTPGLVSRAGMYAGYPSPVGQLGPMARTVTDLAKMLDVMVGYDPEDPITALGVGMSPPSYLSALDKNGLKGARIGIIRDTIGSVVSGTPSEPESEDYKKVEAAFNKAIDEMKAAGAEIVDPVVIPNLRKLLATRTSAPGESAASLQTWLARNPDSPFKTEEDVRNSPDIGKLIPPSKAAQWTRPSAEPDPAKYYAYLEAREGLRIALAKAMADYRLDAVAHQSIEHQPTLIADGINPPYINQKGAPDLNTFLVYAAAMTVPAGYTTDGLPVGVTFFGKPYAEATLLKLAYAFEQLSSAHRHPPASTPPLPAK